MPSLVQTFLGLASMLVGLMQREAAASSLGEAGGRELPHRVLHGLGMVVPGRADGPGVHVSDRSQLGRAYRTQHQGSGTLDVAAASLCQPGAVYNITAGASPFLVQAGTDGRLRFSVN